jgi:hypothetical protein
MSKALNRPAGPVLWLDRFTKDDSQEICRTARRIARSGEFDAAGLLHEIEEALKSQAYPTGGLKGRDVDAAWDRLKAFRSALKADPEEATRFAGVVLAREAVR